MLSVNQRHRRAMYTTVSTVALLMTAIMTGQAHAETVGPGESRTNGVVLADGESLTNHGAISNAAGLGVDGVANVGFILNSSTGTIEALGDWGIGVSNNLDSFENHGLVTTDTNAALGVGGNLGNFINTGTMTSTGGAGVGVGGNVNSFTNSGTIRGGSDPAAVFFGNVGSFSNSGLLESPTGWTTLRFEGQVGSISNSGTIRNTGNGAGVEADLDNGSIASFDNSGTITGGAGQRGVSFYNNGNSVGTFSNSGTITGGNWEAVHIGGGVQKFVNTETGAIRNVDAAGTEGHGVSFNTGTTSGGAVVAFENHGEIQGDLSEDSHGVGFFSGGDGTAHQVGSFTNTGTITGGRSGVGAAGGFGTFSNAGVISSTTGHAVWADSPTGSFANSGTIVSTQENGVDLWDDVGTFENSGTIRGQRYGVILDNRVTSFKNSGTISGEERIAARIGFDIDSFINTGSITAGDWTGVELNGAAGAFNNAGTIKSANDDAVRINNMTGDFINSGIIDGRAGVTLNGNGNRTVINSGKIVGGNWGAINVGNGDDLLVLKTGSQIVGDVNLGGGTNTVDVSGLAGNAVIDIFDLQDLVKGDRIALYQNDRLVVVESTGIVEGASSGVTTIATGVSNLITPVLDGVLSGPSNGGIEPLGYMPSAPQTAADMAIIDPPAHSATAWATAIGGGSHDAAPVDVNSLYGALVAGTHALLAPNTTLGVLGGIGSGRVNTNNGGQIVDSVTGLAGFYGRHDAGAVAFDFSLIGGYAGNDSRREVAGPGGLETARASYSSWFISPSIGVAIPVLNTGTGEVDLVGKVSYVGGSVAGYTETGSSVNLTVGSQSIGLVDARIGLAGTFDTGAAGTTKITANAGLFAQANIGGTTVPITFLGQTQNAAVAGATDLGLYGGLGIATQVTPNVKLTAGADAQWKFNGEISGAVRAGISASF